MLWINSSFSADQKRKADGEREKSVDRCGLNWDVVAGDSDTGAGSGLGYLGGDALAHGQHAGPPQGLGSSRPPSEALPSCPAPANLRVSGLSAELVPPESARVIKSRQDWSLNTGSFHLVPRSILWGQLLGQSKFEACSKHKTRRSHGGSWREEVGQGERVCSRT